jgi:hypothetical protein
MLFNRSFSNSDVRSLSFLNTELNSNSLFSSSSTIINNNNNYGISLDGLVAYYPFDNDTLDYSGYVNTGTGYNITYSTGHYSKSILLNGSTNYVNLGTPTILKLNNSWSISAWVNPYNLGSKMAIVTKGTSGYSADNFYMYINTAKHLEVGIQNYSGEGSASGTSTLSVNNWYHLVGTFNGSQISIYVNGINEANTTRNGPVSYTYNPDLHIGGYTAAGENFNGTIDSISIWNRTLSYSEVNNLYNNPNPLISSNNYYIKQLCTWEGNATSGATCSNNKIMRGINITSYQILCC